MSGSQTLSGEVLTGFGAAVPHSLLMRLPLLLLVLLLPRSLGMHKGCNRPAAGETLDTLSASDCVNAMCHDVASCTVLHHGCSFKMSNSFPCTI